MTGSDIVAIVGAAAWAPQIIQWINEARKRPGQVKEPTQEIIRSKEFQQAVQFLTDSVFWREGTYVLEVQVSGKQLKGIHREAFQVTLTRREIEELQANLQLIKEGLQEYVTSGQRIQKQWVFIHPSMSLASG